MSGSPSPGTRCALQFVALSLTGISREAGGKLGLRYAGWAESPRLGTSYDVCAMASDVESRVGAGFEAMASGDWSGARDAFAAVLGEGEVPEALLGLANACYWLGDLPVGCQKSAWPVSCSDDQGQS
jgi:hypothetical protein